MYLFCYRYVKGMLLILNRVYTGYVLFSNRYVKIIGHPENPLRTLLGPPFDHIQTHPWISFVTHWVSPCYKSFLDPVFTKK